MKREVDRSINTNLLGAIASNTLATMITSASGSTLVGKAAGGDFTIAYTSARTLTAAGLPAAIAVLASDDILAVLQYDSNGNYKAIYTRDTSGISVAANVITIGGASFLNTDTFVVYTNYPAAGGSSGGSILGTTSSVTTLVTGADIGVVNDTWIDQGVEIDCRTYGKIGIFIIFTVNDSTGNQIQILSKSAALGANEFVMETASSYQKTIGNASIDIFYEFEVDAIVPYIQIQTKATIVDTGGGTEGTVTIYITKGY